MDSRCQELHAHLSGSITRETLHDIWLDRKRADPALALADPLELIPEGGIDDIEAFVRVPLGQLLRGD